ncbi:MAG: S53 family peptidase [Patescibacteria group bacterium]|nr:S53 family peptidase [Patescibacteria group bacterium]
MKKLLFLPVVLGIALIFGVFSFSISSFAAPNALPDQALSNMPVCPPGPNNTDVRCHARVVVDKGGKPQTTSNPAAYGPVQLRTAYNLNGTNSSGKILAIVDAYDDPTIENDLNSYNSQYNLGLFPTCTPDIVSSGVPCFQKVDQNGGSNYPSVNSGWALEISLDVEVAHAVCPDCKILLVEANSNSFSDLAVAEDRAYQMGAAVISNSYGGGEFSSESSYDSHYNHPGVAITFSSGDNGYGTSYPAASQYVTAVGGTSLYLNTDNTWNSESVWSGTGSGCSKYESKPSFQHDSGCSHRTIGDVAADADPNTGAAVYDTTPYNGQTGWFKVGGTSLSSPIVAAVYALKGVTPGSYANSLPYANGNLLTLHDITSGKNGRCSRSTPYLCTAEVGYDGPTGLGTPNGIDAF